MKNDGYKIRDQQGIFFITFAVVQWIDVFTRREYADIVIESMHYCIQHKALKVHAWCIMSNHVHLIVSTNDNLSDILRDFKKFTSKAIIEAIKNNDTESRKNWMLWIFKKAGEKNSRNQDYQFWVQDNHPIQLQTIDFTLSKLNYLHNNPVKAGMVEKPEDYLLSSAKYYYSGSAGLLPLEYLSAASSYKFI